MYKLVFSALAANKLRKIPWKQQEQIEKVLDELRESPSILNPLQRELIGRFKERVGVYRIIYKVNFEDRVITVLNIDHRSKVYN